MNNYPNILHISTDEKFIDMALRTFEKAAPGHNKLIILSRNKEIKYIKYKNARILSKSEFSKLTKSHLFWSDIDIIIFHSLCTFNAYIPYNIKTIWIGFGFDYYDLISSKNTFLGNKTKKIVTSSLSIEEYLLSKLKTLLLWNLYKKVKKNNFIKKINYFCPVLTTEYDLIKWNKNNKPKLIDWNYGTLEDDWAKSGNQSKLTGSNILLGNSATYSCNHIEGIDLLNKLKIKKSKLIIPLSYGNKKYASIIKQYIKNNYSGETVILDDYISFDEYSNLIASCSHIIMPHKRQQALGNIIMSLYLGAKIFLDKTNPIYIFFKKNGVIIYSLDDINDCDFNIKLTDNEVEINKNFAFRVWNQDVMLEKTNKLIGI